MPPQPGANSNEPEASEQLSDAPDGIQEVPLHGSQQPPVLDDTDAIVRAAKAMRAKTAPQAGKRCLVVDDSRVVRKLARKIAEQMGYRVAEAENGEEALARCRAAIPDLVITDWQMPVMDGPEFVAALRTLPGAVAVKVMFCTSKSEATDIHQGINAGADDYIVKPFDEAKLTAKLERLVAG
ncbi:response regulator [Qipengyuania sp. CAU 1752]